MTSGKGWLIAGAVIAALGVGGFVLRDGRDPVHVSSQSPSQGRTPIVPAAGVRSDVSTDTGVVAADVAPDAGISASSLADGPDAGALALDLGAGGDAEVSATVIGGSVVASLPSGEAPLATAPAPRPKVGTGAPMADANAPRFDLVRVDRAGAAVVAGKALPGRRVDVYVDGDVIAEVVADSRGAFVALFDVPQSPDPQVLSLASHGEAGDLTPSAERVLVIAGQVSDTAGAVQVEVGPDLPRDEAPEPTVIIASSEGVRVAQPPALAGGTPEVMANVTIDVISYDDAGEVVLTGRGQAERHVRVYVDNRPVRTEAVDEAGSWQMSLPEVDAGRYTLRVDEIDEAGKVTSRLETPFQKEQPEKVLAASLEAEPPAPGQSAAPPVDKVTIQTGATLWALAQNRWGEGNLYMQIFNANRDQIRNPDLIYPGQIFRIPD
ncbi:MAG: LysM peptidoglycan-binding domain-containing protein [Rhodobacteraceae bacterium]|nr:LysM peptidoglycan-binding domain-containing protein [Paracoccaceae bacterium]